MWAIPAPLAKGGFMMMRSCPRSLSGQIGMAAAMKSKHVTSKPAAFKSEHSRGSISMRSR